MLLTIVWLTRGHFGRTNIWVIQQEWFFALNHFFSGWPKLLWTNLTQVGNAVVLLLLLSPLIIWHKQAWLAMLGAAPAAATFSVAGKYFAAIPRPAAVLDHSQFTIIGDILTRHNSLPSGHSITVFAGLIAILAILIPHPQSWRQWMVILTSLLIATLLCLSRIAVGAHWPIDILVGAAFGWIAGLSGAAIIQRGQRWQWPNTVFSYRVSSLALLVWSLLLIRHSVEAPFRDISLWLAASCGIVTGLWLLSQSFAILLNFPQISET